MAVEPARRVVVGKEPRVPPGHGSTALHYDGTLAVLRRRPGVNQARRAVERQVPPRPAVAGPERIGRDVVGDAGPVTQGEGDKIGVGRAAAVHPGERCGRTVRLRTVRPSTDARQLPFAIARNVVVDNYRAGAAGSAAPLPPEQREIVELRLAGLTGPEIARTLGKSHGAVKVAQFRAFTRLRAMLSDQRRTGPTTSAQETSDARSRPA